MCVLALALLPALGARSLWSSDEIRYVEVARQARDHGHVLVPHRNGEVYAEKPPLFFWATAALGRVVEISVAGRLVCWGATVLTALCVAGVGRRLFGVSEVGWLAALLYLGLPSTAERAQEALLDPMVVACVWVGLWALLEAGWASTRRGCAAGVALGAAATTAGCLTKGPVVLVPLVLALPLWLRGSGAPRRRGAWVGLGVACGAALALTYVWLSAAAEQAGEAYERIMAVRQLKSRVGSGTHAHPEPWWFYLVDLPLKTLPWSAFVPWLLTERRGWSRAQRDAAWRVGVWGVVGVAVFSAIGSKRFGYVLPFAPFVPLWVAGALLGGGTNRWVDGILRASRPVGRVGAGGLVVGGVAAAFGASWVGATWLTPGWALWTAAAGAGALALTWRVPRGRRGWATGLAVYVLCGQTVAFGVVSRGRDPGMAFVHFARSVEAEVPDLERLRQLGQDYDGRLCLYVRREAVEVVPLEEAAAALRAGDLWVAQARVWGALPEEVRARGVVRVEREVDKRTWLLIEIRGEGASAAAKTD